MKITALLSTALLALAARISTDMLQSAQATATSADRSALIAAVDSIATEVLSRSIPGLSVAVAQGDEIILAKGYGFADLENRIPATANTRYQIGSVTKQFTAAAIMRLVEVGSLRLDDNISEYLPDFPTQGHEVTTHHLLNHTAGIKSYTDFVTDFTADLTPQLVLDLVKNEPFAFEPGEAYDYNNTGYYLLGLIIERLSGQSYGEYLLQQFFDPLKMTATSYCGTGPNTEVPTGYVSTEWGLVRAQNLGMMAAYAAGALCSTVTDLVQWQRALVRGGVVSAATYARMITPAKLSSGGALNYGYGLVSDSRRGHPYIWHNGQIAGFHSQLAFYPDDRLTVVVLANSILPDGPEPIEQAIARATLGIHVADQPISAAERAKYVGTYDLGPFIVRVLEEDNALKAQPTGQDASRLMYQGEQTFRLELDPDIRLVFEVADGIATQLTLYQDHIVLSAERVK